MSRRRYVGGIADYNGQISEASDTNNTYNAVAITVAAVSQPDLWDYVMVANTAVTIGGYVTIDSWLSNHANGAAASSVTGFFLSTDATITTSDWLLATRTSPALAAMGAPGSYDYQGLTVSVPLNLTPGTYYIGGIADYTNQISETDDSNNNYNAVAITVAAASLPDLWDYVMIGNTTIAAGGSVTIDSWLSNHTNGAASFSFTG
jgi:subtilase family serine protease